MPALFLSRWFLAWHGLCAFSGWHFPMSEYVFRCVDSLNSTASLVLAVVFCVWKGGCRVNQTNWLRKVFAGTMVGSA